MATLSKKHWIVASIISVVFVAATAQEKVETKLNDKEIISHPANWAARLRRPIVDESTRKDIFSGTSWASPLRRAPADSPSVPPFQFNYMGRLVQEGALPIVLLTKGDWVYSVSVGDTLEGTYRIEGIEEDHIELTYLPLNKRQTIVYESIIAHSTRVPSHGASIPAVAARSDIPYIQQAGTNQDNRVVVPVDSTRAETPPTAGNSDPQDSGSQAGGATNAVPSTKPMEMLPSSKPMEMLPPGKPMEMLPPGAPMKIIPPAAPTS